MKLLWIVAGNVLFWLTLHLGIAYLANHLPLDAQKRVFDPRRRRYAVTDRQMRFYRRIGLPRWKDRLPQYRPRGAFDKKQLQATLDEDYVETFVRETCKAQTVHGWIQAAGFLSLLFCLPCAQRVRWLVLYAVIAVAMAAWQIPFVWIQKYNRYRLRHVRQRKNRQARSTL